jgi:hypothetical protein
MISKLKPINKPTINIIGEITTVLANKVFIKIVINIIKHSIIAIGNEIFIISSTDFGVFIIVTLSGRILV